MNQLLKYLSLFILAYALPTQVMANNEKTNKVTKSEHSFVESNDKAITNQTSHVSAEKIVKFIRIKVVELQDNNGLKYIGGYVNKADLMPYLAQLKSIVGEEKYRVFRENQARRDHQSFHITLINPIEYQHMDRTIETGGLLSFSLQGLGHVESGDKSSYFVVAQSSNAQFYRQRIALPPKDFHVTLGFNPSDIYGVSKGVDTIIR